MLKGHQCNSYCVNAQHRDVFLVPHVHVLRSAYYRERYDIAILAYAPTRSELTPHELLASGLWDADSDTPGSTRNAETLTAYDVTFTDHV